MPYHATTPEVLAARLIGRTDSRNPATTCRGISVSTGKPCRRSIASAAPKGHKSGSGGNEEGNNVNPAEEFFCWQHKDQAEDTVVLHRSDSQKLRRLQGRTSLDTLVEVILGVEGGDEAAAGTSGGAGSGIGPDHAEVIIRRQTPLNDDEIMVVRKKSVVRKDSNLMKEAKRREPGQKAVWDALHGQGQPVGHAQSHSGRPPARPGRVHTGHSTGTGMGVITEAPGDTYPANNEFKPRPRPPQRKRPSLLAQLFCCGTDYSDDISHSQSARPSKNHEKSRPKPPYPTATSTAPQMPHHRPEQHIHFTNQPRPPAPIHYPNITPQNNGYKKPSKAPVKPIADLDISSESDSDSGSDTASTVIIPNVQSITPPLPSHLSAKTRALITAQLRKPISEKDAPGYIYVFLLKDKKNAPPPALASNNGKLAAPGKSSNRPRKPSYSKDPGSAALFRAVDDDDDDDDDTTNGTSKADKRVLLKIGRAQNVQRRLHQWSQQCGYNLHLLRYYPYVPLMDSPSPSPSPSRKPVLGKGKASSPPAVDTTTVSISPGTKVPYAHRVEHLIHLELRDEYYNKPHVCEECGRVHKEWFAVPGSKEGIGRVDEVVKRWCKWGEDVQQVVNGGSLGGRTTDNSNSNSNNNNWSVRMVDENSDRRNGADPDKDRRKVTGGVRGVEPVKESVQQERQRQQQQQPGQYAPYRSQAPMQTQSGMRETQGYDRPKYGERKAERYDRDDSRRRRDRY